MHPDYFGARLVQEPTATQCYTSDQRRLKISEQWPYFARKVGGVQVTMEGGMDGGNAWAGPCMKSSIHSRGKCQNHVRELGQIYTWVPEAKARLTQSPRVRGHTRPQSPTHCNHNEHELTRSPSSHGYPDAAHMQ
jgi:hypothetical protein